jgi:hypothetical protein
MSLFSKMFSGLKLSLFGKVRRSGFFDFFSPEKAAHYLLGVLVFLALLVVGWDSYLFYANVLRREKGAGPATVEKVTLPEKDIDDVVKILDDRAQRFKDILSGKASSQETAGTSATSTAR